MSVIWYKVWSDLWDNKVRTTLAVLSITVGVFSIGAIFGMVDQLLSTMDKAHQEIIPSHIRMGLEKRITRDIADRLEHTNGVEAIELYNRIMVRYKTAPDEEWKTGIVYLRDDYADQTYELVQLKEGRWPDDNHIAIERLSSQAFGINIGDQVIFELAGSDRALSVVGKVRDSFVEPPQFGGDAVFYVADSGLERFGVPEGEFGAFLARVTPYSAELAKDVASALKDNLAKEGVDVNVTFYQDPKEHWGRRFVVGLNFILQILAVVSLFMSVILVLNTLTALITQQTNQIGIIKAIGGTVGVLIKTYLAGVLVYGLLALLVSLPLGAYLAFSLSQWFLNFFNIDYNIFQFSPQAVLYQLIAAIIAPVLAALWPILSGAAITVREAIASYGLGGGKLGGTWLDRGVETVGRRFLAAPYAVALGNMFRRKGRLLMTQLVLISAGTMFLIIMSFSTSLKLTLDNFFGREQYDITLIFEDNQRIDRAVRMAESLPGVEQAEISLTQPAAILKEGQRMSEAGIGATMIGFGTTSDFYRPLIIEGRWFTPGDGRVILISEDTSLKNNIKPGDTVTVDLGALGDTEWQVIGIFQTVFGSDFDPDPIYAPQEAIFQSTTKHNVGDRLHVRTHSSSESYSEAVRLQLENMYEERSMDVAISETKSVNRRGAEEQFGIIIGMLLALAVIVAVVGGIGLMGSLSISVVERTREIGVMRAIGARSSTIMGMLMMEGVLQGVLSWAIATPIAFALGQPLTITLGKAFEVALDYRFNLEAVLMWLLIVLVIATFASILPARNATQISVRESLAYA
jgi:putative ABC transport system permease protein